MSISFDENDDQCLETSGKMFEREKLKKIRGIILFMDRRLIEKVGYFGVASMIILIQLAIWEMDLELWSSVFFII